MDQTPAPTQTDTTILVVEETPVPRRATLGFYRVHLPFFGLQREQVLYLNPAYDVI